VHCRSPHREDALAVTVGLLKLRGKEWANRFGC
jgi:hypothetical protein